jgi:PTS system mannose-specific IIA component
MSQLTAVVIVTHGQAGADMVDAAQKFLHMELAHVGTVGVAPEDDRTAVDNKISRAVSDLGLESCEDVLFLVDLVGSTPAQLCCRKCGGQSGHVVTGINMPMLLKLATADRSRGPELLGNDLVATGTKSIHCE